jgi:hypothetical protein
MVNYKSDKNLLNLNEFLLERLTQSKEFNLLICCALYLYYV